MQAGLIGLGRMGRAMAGRLEDEGVELVVWSRTAGKAAGLKAAVAGSPAEVARRVPVVVLSLLDSQAVREVLEGPQGLLEGGGAGRLYIDTTTNHFQAVGGFHEAAQKHGSQYLEAPVSGTVGPASRGQLSVYASGTREAFEQARPLLEKLARSVNHVGGPGMAARFKLINNMVLGSFMGAIAEAVDLCERIGLGREQALELLASGAGRSGLMDAKKDKLARLDFSADFPAGLMYRDLEYVQDLGEELRLPLFSGRLARELYALAVSKDYDDLDFSVLYKALKEM